MANDNLMTNHIILSNTSCVIIITINEITKRVEGWMKGKGGGGEGEGEEEEEEEAEEEKKK